MRIYDLNQLELAKLKAGKGMKSAIGLLSRAVSADGRRLVVTDELFETIQALGSDGWPSRIPAQMLEDLKRGELFDTRPE